MLTQPYIAPGPGAQPAEDYRSSFSVVDKYFGYSCIHFSILFLEYTIDIDIDIFLYIHIHNLSIYI